MTSTALSHARHIFEAATPVIRIHSVGGKRWKRNVAKGARIGPWLQARYDIVNETVWRDRTPCMYLVSGTDGHIRYVGISRNRLADRWRVSPAYDADTMTKLTERQLFHSQCWKHIERESSESPGSRFEVRCISGEKLLSVLKRLGPPLAAFTALEGDGEGIVAGVERWMCNNKGAQLVSWNVAMTA